MAAGKMGRKLVKAVLGVVGAIVVLLAAITLLLQTSAVSRRVMEVVVPRASEALGREVTVRDARLHLIPGPRVDLAGAAVAGRPGEPPLVQLDALQVSLELWPLVTSLGKDVRVKAIHLVRPVVNLVRASDGSWNYQGLGGAAPAREPPAPSAPSDRKLVVARATIDDGSVRIVDRSAAGDEAAVAISRIGFDARNVGAGEPLAAKLSAAIAGDQPNFEAQLDVSRLPASVTELGPGRYPELRGQLALKSLDLARLRAFLPPSVTGVMTGGRVDADAKLSTREQRYHVDGGGKLSQVRLRGEPAQGSFELHAVADPAAGTAHATLDKLALRGPGVDLGGHVTLDTRPQRVRFAISGPLLDLGQVMGLLPPQQEKQQQSGFALTAAQRRAAEALDVAGTIDIQKVVKGAFTATDFKATAVLEKGAFVLHQAQAGFFGGRVDASGTRLDVAPAVPTWTLKTRLQAIDVGQAMSALSGSVPLTGKLNGGVDLAGAGVDWESLRKAITGQGAVQLQQGALTTADVGDEVLGAVAKGLRAAGKGGAAATVSGASGKTPLRDLAAQFTVKDGAMALSKPLALDAPFGAATLDGKIGLDGAVALQGTAQVSKQALAGVVGSGLPLPASLPVPLSLGGTLAHPTVHVDAQGAVTSLVSGAARQGVQQLQNRAQDEAKRAAGRGLGDLLKGLGK